MNEEFERLQLLIGDKIHNIKNKTVLIIGLGGVGGYAIEALARLGVNNFILVDGDIIERTNINRQIIATNQTINMNKTDAWEQRIKLINEGCHIIKITEFITSDNIDLLFEYNIDYLIDAIDTVKTKCEIIRQCLKQNIPFISSMGMGNKLDPTKIEIMDISKTSYDPIAKVIRKMVKDECLKGKIMTVSSSEAPLKNKEGHIASNAIVPSVAGLLCADYIFKQMIGE